jgi:hypothetical protein
MSFLGSLFPTRIELLLEKRDLQGLLEALQFKRGTRSMRAIHYRRDAAKALGKVALPEVVESLIEALTDDPKVKRAARAALMKLTGKEDLGGSQQRWRKWWAANEVEPVWLGDLMERHRTTAREKHRKAREEALREKYSSPEPPLEVRGAYKQLLEGDYYSEQHKQETQEVISQWEATVKPGVELRVAKALQKLERKWEKEDQWVESFRSRQTQGT